MSHIKIGPLKLVDFRQKSKCPTSYHFSTDRQLALILLFMALSSLDINKMASKNLFYINRLQDIGRGVFENFWKFYFGQNKRIWYSEIPSSIPHFSNVFRIHSNQSWNFLEFILIWAKSEKNFSKWIPQMPFCCVSRNSFSFSFLAPFEPFLSF